MRDWLINVMAELADRKELSYFYQEMKRKAEVIKKSIDMTFSYNYTICIMYNNMQCLASNEHHFR